MFRHLGQNKKLFLSIGVIVLLIVSIISLLSFKIHDRLTGKKSETRLTVQKGSIDIELAAETKSIFDFSIGDTELSQYRGKKAYLLVNVASKWGLAEHHYAQLQVLHESFEPYLEVMAFPCNDFKHQEPGSREEIKQFASSRGATFPIFDKITCHLPSDAAKQLHPLYNYLTRDSPLLEKGELKWNYEKFLVNDQGVPIARFGPKVQPMNIKPAIQKLINSYKDQ